MTLHPHTVNSGGNETDLLLVGSFPIDLASRHLPMFYLKLWGFIFLNDTLSSLYHPLPQTSLSLGPDSEP